MMKTHTRIHSRQAQKQERREGLAASLRTMISFMMGAQLLLWVVFFGYDRSVQAVWQSALMLIVPLLLLYFLWKDAPKSPKLCLLLLPCLMADAAFVLFALGGYISQLIPIYPDWVGIAVPAVIVLLTALTARPEGTARGAYALKGLLVLLFIFGTVFLRASNRADRLWPLMGKGLGAQGKTALMGSGSVWMVPLLFILPPRGKKAARYALLPWAAGCLWALWFGFVRPWAFGDEMSIAEKMMGLARHAHSITLYEIAGLLWMLLLPLALCGCFSSAEMLVRLAFPQCPRIWPLLFALVPGAACLWLIPEKMPSLLETILPYRTAVSLAAGAAIRFANKEKKR